MGRHSKIILLAAISAGLFLMTCKKQDGAGCFKNSGPVEQDHRTVPGFRSIQLHDNIDLVLTQKSGNNTILVETGKNLIDGIETTVSGSRLYIRNHNWCNWMRSFDVPIRVYVTVSSLDSLEYRSSGDVSCTNALLNDSIKVDIWEGSGSIDLKLEMEKAFFTLHEGAVDLTATGNVWVNFISSHGLGPVDCMGLTSQYAFVGTSSPNHCYVNVEQYLDGSIDNIGNVYYKGNPSTINMRVQGGGQLIKIE